VSAGSLRFAAARWLIAEVIPFGFLAGGLALAREAGSAGRGVGFILAFIGGSVLTVFYLYKVLGAAIGWTVPIVVLMISGTLIGNIVVVGYFSLEGTRYAGGTHQGAYRIAFTVVLVALAIVVALAVVNGERWLRSNRGTLPTDKFNAYKRSRGTMAPR
jgi:hypothetical protein